MKLSPETLSILSNFASINPNLVVNTGNVLTTVNGGVKNILATATIAESFPQTFGIYDLGEFLKALSLVSDAELDFTTDSVLLVDGRRKVKYRFSDPSVLSSPPAKKLVLPSADLEITLTGETISAIRKAAGVFGHTVVAIAGKKGVVSADVLDPKNDSANTYSIIVDENNPCKSEFNFQFLIGNLKLLDGDYNVAISSKFLSKWVNTTSPIEYFLALEKTSTFNS
jgi:hypothetical protein